MTLCVFSLIIFSDSSFIRGLFDQQEGISYWDSPRVRFPDKYVFTIAVIMVYGAVVSAEGLLSLLLGKVHATLMGATGLLSGIGYCYISIIASPAMMTIITGHVTYYGEILMGFTLGAGLLSVIHGIITLIQPKRVVSPLNIPGILEKASVIKDAFQRLENHASAASLHHGNVLTGIENILPGGSGIYDWKLALLSLISLILASVGAGGRPWSQWPNYVLIGSNMTVLSRILPSVIAKEEEKPSAFKTLLISIVEGLPSLVGAIGGWFAYDGPIIAAGVITFIITLLELRILISGLKVNVSFHKEDRQLLQNEEGQAEQSEDEAVLVPVV
ncbi:uncharacterized protein LOC134788744 [Penaeus indicus]|uniref:uncharacterized protein LOC134788744 n=1 Tax=Penaeus indicus TaxID=29960 RepID=UPI00300DB4FB